MNGIWKFCRHSSVPTLVGTLLVTVSVGALTAGCASQQQTLTATECDALPPEALLTAIDNGECRAFLTKLERIQPAARLSGLGGNPDSQSDENSSGGSSGESSAQSDTGGGSNDTGGGDTGGGDTGGGCGGHGGGHGGGGPGGGGFGGGGFGGGGFGGGGFGGGGFGGGFGGGGFGGGGKK